MEKIKATWSKIPKAITRYESERNPFKKNNVYIIEISDKLNQTFRN
jgi:hypothetical protein